MALQSRNHSARVPSLLHLLFLLALGALAACSEDGTESPTDTRPNILLIVADDLGYADLGVHGSDIRTPNVDALAGEGLRFSQFHTSPLCAPTRAMLLSGNNNHVAGMGRQHSIPPGLAEQPGYEQHLSDRIVPFPRLLRDAGYHTYMAGKWHLGEEAEHSPVAAGFERSFAMLQGGASHFDGRGFENRPSSYREDGELTDWPEGAYSTEFYTDRIISYIDEQKSDGKPFFVYAAYTSPHWPLQVPDDERDRYAGAYDDGYDALREENFAALQEAGMVSEQAELPPRNDAVTPWQDLDDDARRRESRKMELYAAMVENLDTHVGRLLDYLRETGQYENTLIVFMGDNGAANFSPIDAGPFVEFVRGRYENRFEDWGGAESFVAYDTPWAEAGSAPFKRYKTFMSEGGVVAPFVIAGPGVAADDAISHAYLTVMDLAPTFLALAGAEYPSGESVRPLLGASLLPFLAGNAEFIHEPDYVTVMEQDEQALVRQGNWKLTAIDTPFSEERFRLYDIATDPGEVHDLSDEFPDKREELLETWRQKRQELGIVLSGDL